MKTTRSSPLAAAAPPPLADARALVLMFATDDRASFAALPRLKRDAELQLGEAHGGVDWILLQHKTDLIGTPREQITLCARCTLASLRASCGVRRAACRMPPLLLLLLLLLLPARSSVAVAAVHACARLDREERVASGAGTRGGSSQSGSVGCSTMRRRRPGTEALATP